MLRGVNLQDLIFYPSCFILFLCMSGCGSVWLERSVRDAEAAGSNPAIPTIPSPLPAIMFQHTLPALFDPVYIFSEHISPKLANCRQKIYRRSKICAQKLQTLVQASFY